MSKAKLSDHNCKGAFITLFLLNKCVVRKVQKPVLIKKFPGKREGGALYLYTNNKWDHVFTFYCLGYDA